MTVMGGALGRFMYGAYASRTVAGFCLLLGTALWIGALTEVQLDRDRTLAREMAENAAIARVLEETVSRVVKNADQVVRVVKSRHEREGRKFDLLQYMRDGMITSQPYNMVSIADENGILVQTSQPSGPVSIADREHFRVHADRNTDELHIGRPAMGRVTGKWTVYLTRRINKSDGTFGGVALVGLDPGALSEVFRRIDLGPASTVTLVGLDGQVRARQSEDDFTPGQDVSQGRMLTRQLPSREHGSYLDASMIDRVTRVFSYRTMRDYPLVIAVGTAEVNALAGAERRKAGFVWGAAISSAAIMLFAALFALQSRRQARVTLRLQQELERQVEQRTERLSEANKDLESFTYSVSHDLRTPLRAIAGFSQILARRQRDRLDEQGRHYLDNIVEASGHMGRLIDELLTYSRLGRQAVDLRPVRLAEVFAKVHTHLQARITSLGAQVSFPADPPAVLGEDILLYQVFLNLVDNALTYAQPGFTPVVAVSVSLSAEHVTVTVADRGIGIAPEHFESIFGVFQRLHRQEEYPGTGIGLATVKRAVDLVGGSVWVNSDPGRGSSFFVKLNRGRDE